MRIILGIVTIGCLAYAASASDHEVKTDIINNAIARVTQAVDLIPATDAAGASSGDITPVPRTAESGPGMDKEKLKKLLGLLKKIKKDNNQTESVEEIYKLIKDPELIELIKRYI